MDVKLVRDLAGALTLWVVALGVFGAGSSATAQTVSAPPPIAGTRAPLERLVTPRVEADFLLARDRIAPGETVGAALRLRAAPGWHTYWVNPGDSGLPTQLAWTLPPGWRASAFEWPTPSRQRFGPLMNFGYEGETLYPFTLTAPDTANAGPVQLTAAVAWLVCKDVCIPEEGLLALPLAVGPGGRDTQAAGLIADARAAVPRPEPSIVARVTATPQGVALTAAGGPLNGADFSSADLADAFFFPFEGAIIDHAAPQAPQGGPEGVRLTLQPIEDAGVGDGPIAGVLAVTRGAQTVGYRIEATPGPELSGVAAAPLAGGAAPAPTEPTPAESIGLAGALLFALLGGMILNLMPCVLPVISLKALTFVRDASAGEARRHGLIYGAGVLVSFLALGALVSALAGAGEGWGFHLQSPLVVGALALLFFAIGLNLLGAYDLGGAVQNVGAAAAGKPGDAGAFFTGALAVVAATPCTAPFMAAALGFALTQPPAAALSVFAALGVGFAAPVVALSLSPGVRGFIPKPGPWMARFKEVLAFPMFLTAIWLIWVLATVGGAGAVASALAAAAAIGFAVWAGRNLRGRSRTGALAGLALVALVVGWAALRPGAQPLTPEPWSAARVAEITAAGRPALVNFTADWCITCKANEQVAFAAPAVARAVDETQAAYLVADWTARDPVIAAELARHGRSGVPLYLVYPAGGGAPKVLPQILTPGTVVDALRAAARAPPGGPAARGPAPQVRNPA